MSCLDAQQLARLVLDHECRDLDTEHVDNCPTCRGRLMEMQTLCDRLARAHTCFGQGHDARRAELMQALTKEDRVVKRAPAGRPIRTWLGGLTMTQKTVLGGLGMAAILLVVLTWSTSTIRRATAMERMAQEVRKATSYEMTVDVQLEENGNVVKAPPSKMYWQAPRSYRTESGRQLESESESVQIYPSEKPGIDINRFKKEFRRKPARRGQVSPFMLLNDLGRFSGEADRNLGTRQIDGHAARGFVIDAHKIDPDAYSGPVEIWLDSDTNLPVRVEYHLEAQTPATLVMRDIHWNVKLDPKLFDTTPPEGYVDATPKPIALDEQVREITLALRTYAELLGEYPQAKTVYGDVTRDEMYESIGIKHGRPTPEQSKTDAYVKVLKAMKGFALLNAQVFRENPDGAYYGLSVSPQDADKLLLRWKLDDGRYQVVYGDLKTEIVSPERLRELEK